MSRSAFVHKVEQTRKLTWPEVRDTVARRRGSTNKTVPDLAHRETVWQIAKQGLLRSEADVELIEAVRDYLCDLDPSDLDEYETRLTQALAAVVESEDQGDVPATEDASDSA